MLNYSVVDERGEVGDVALEGTSREAMLAAEHEDSGEEVAPREMPRRYKAWIQ